MSDKTKLNPELTELENSLLSLAIPDCNVNRDELMYRSGWEAALASSKSSAQLSSAQLSLTEQKTGRHWLFATISVFSSAAAILFGVMLLSQKPNQGEVELSLAKNVAPTGVVPTGVDSAEPVSAEKAKISIEKFEEVPDLLQLVMDLPCSQTLHAGMVVGPDFPIKPEPSFNSPVSPSSKNLTPPMTQQELLDELLPNRFDRSPKWSLFRMGGNS